MATSVVEAKARAKKLVRSWQAPHRDEMYEAEQAFALDQSILGERLYIHLEASPGIADFAFTCDYKRIS